MYFWRIGELKDQIAAGPLSAGAEIPAGPLTGQ
jgi:hypothetical protein